MTNLARRFYRAVTVVGDAASFGVALDGRPVKTPGKAAFAVPTRPMADAVAQEWEAQGERIDPFSMRLTRLANTAIDRVLPDRARIEAGIARMAEHDLVCYRAGEPHGLRLRQAAAWDPVIDWAMAALDARFAVTTGIVHVDQPPAALAAFQRHLRSVSPWGLTAIHNMATLAASALIAANCAAGARGEGEAWSAAHVDEDWQIEHWGADAEAQSRLAHRHADFLACCRMIRLTGPA